MKKNSMLLILLFISSVMSTSCAFLERRDFENEMSEFRNDDPMFIAGRDFQVTAGDEGRHYRDASTIRSRTPATLESAQKMKYHNSIKKELYSLENRLTEAEYNDYKKVRNQLGNDSEKIYFLNLSQRERNDYLRIRNIETPRYYTVKESRMAAFSNEIILGMKKQDVIRSWGKPERKDYSGNPRLENERWAYSRNGTVKYVYFTGGSVEGWTEQ